MKHTFQKLILILLVFIPLLIQGQGIEGRRIAINYDLQWATNVRGIVEDIENEGTIDWTSLYLVPHLIHSAELNYIASRSWVIGPDAQFFRLSIPAIYQPHSFVLNSQELGFHVQKFSSRKGGLAPVGNYFKLRLYQTRGTVTNTDDDSYAGTIWKPGWTISWGKQMIFKKYFLFNTSLGIDGGLGAIRAEENSFIANNGLEITIDDAIQNHRFIFISFGIGWNAGL